MFFSQAPTKEGSLFCFFGCGGEGKAMAVNVFVETFTQEIPPRPASMDRLVTANISA